MRPKMSSLGSLLCSSLCFAVGVAIPLFGLAAAAEAKAKFVTFDVVKGDTFPTDINKFGEIVGFLRADGQSQRLGFLREPDGTFFTIEVPTEVFPQFSDTFAYSINDSGFVAGRWVDLEGLPHCYVFTPAGKFLSCEPEGATSSDGLSINNRRQVVGEYGDQNGTHGFIWSSGVVTTFDIPNAIETLPQSINDHGEIAGRFIKKNRHELAFVREPDGSFATFNAPGADGEFLRINGAGEVAGDFLDSNNVEHSFVRDAAGRVDTFNPKGASQSIATGINKEGVVVGSWFDSTGVALHGYVRSVRGAIKSFDVPRSSGASAVGSTSASAINSAGVIVGNFTRKRGGTSGFIRTP